MERKIGEIKQINEEWYQYVEGRCKDCYFSEKRYFCKQFITKNLCTSGIIFKKLEKVGELVVRAKCFKSANNFAWFPYAEFQKYKVSFPVILPKEPFTHFDEDKGIVYIEIKQNKEDMEEKKLNLKPFNLEAAKAGKPVCTRDGRKARIICFDRIDNTGLDLPIVALIQREETEILQLYREDGKRNVKVDLALDLMMLPEKHEGWVNICKETSGEPYALCNIFEHQKDAVESGQKRKDYLATVKISWEE